MSREKKKTDPVNILLDLIIIILIIAMIPVGFLYYTSKSYAEKPSFTADSQMMGFLLEKKNYASFVQGSYINRYNGDTQTGGYNALADYMEAKFHYRIYDKKGYATMAEKEQAVMEKTRSEMGNLTVFADRFDQMTKTYNE